MFESGLTAGSLASWISAGTLTSLLFLALFGLNMWRKNNREDRQQKINADETLRADLLTRIRELEANQERALEAERRRCDAEMSVMRSDFQKQFDGLMRQFLTFQMALAGSSPPLARSEHTEAALETLRSELGKAPKE